VAVLIGVADTRRAVLRKKGVTVPCRFDHILLDDCFGYERQCAIEEAVFAVVKEGRVMEVTLFVIDRLVVAYTPTVVHPVSMPSPERLPGEWHTGTLD
jgi:hypothetical protein